MRYNDRLQGALTQFLLGNRGLRESLIDTVERLQAHQDLTRIHDALEAILKKMEEDPEFRLPTATLESVQEMLLAKMDGKGARKVDVTPHPSGGGILSDIDIRDLAQNHGMIEPFCERQVTKDTSRVTISHGLSSYGYDARVANEFKVFTNIHTAEVDPKNFDPNSFIDLRANAEGFIRIPPNSFVLGRTVERFRIPRNVLVVCVGKSTYARCGIVVNVTPLEPEWEGHVTLEFSNTTPLPARLYANEGACQFLFFAGTQPCETSYADRGGKYQDQTGVTLPRMK
jgi:dCTP deaminase